jgi:[ribosomal protein S18]-alanine N-acetyltransferase
VRVRPANAADIPALVALERQSSSAAHWTQQYYEGLFLPATDRSTSERYAWVVEEDQSLHPDRNLQTLPRVLGLLIAHRMNDQCELENLVVSTEARRRGVGALLITQLLAHLRETHGSCIFLEVRESNRAARAIYEKFRFETAGLRKNYYSNPQENAVLYRLDLC